MASGVTESAAISVRRQCGKSETAGAGGHSTCLVMGVLAASHKPEQATLYIPREACRRPSPTRGRVISLAPGPGLRLVFRARGIFKSISIAQLDTANIGIPHNQKSLLRALNLIELYHQFRPNFVQWWTVAGLEAAC
jgi:hypothetical protein